MATRSAAALLERIKEIDLGEVTVGLFLASGAQDDDIPTYQQVQVTDVVGREFLEVFRAARERIDQDTVLRPYDPASKPDPHEIEYLGIDQVPGIEAQLAPLGRPARLEVFAAEPNFITGLRFYVLVLQPRRGSPVTALRVYGGQRELARSRSLGFLFRAGQFSEIRQPVFLFDHYLDCLIYDGVAFVLRQHDFQRLFRYYEMVAQAAEESLEAIRQTIPVANFAQFAESCRGHLQKLAKLKNIAQKPYLARVTMADLRRVIERFELNVVIQELDGQESLVFDPSDRWAILRLLDDDYLESMMTEQLYEVTGKRLHEGTALRAGG